MRSGGGGVAIGRGPSTTSTSPATGSRELESQHVDRVGLTQAEVDLVRREQPPRLHPVPLRLLQVGPAEGDQLVALKPADHSRTRPVRPPQPEAELTHEREPLRDARSEEHTSELQSLRHLVCRLLLEKKKRKRRKQLHHQNTPHIAVQTATE